MYKPGKHLTNHQILWFYFFPNMYTTLSTIGLDPQSGLLYQLCLRSSPVACDLHRKLVEVRWCYESQSSQERQQKLVNFMFFWQKIGSKEFWTDNANQNNIYQRYNNIKFWKGNKTHLEFHSIPGSLGFLTFKTPRSTRAGDCENGWSHSSRLGMDGVKLLSIARRKSRWPFWCRNSFEQRGQTSLGHLVQRCWLLSQLKLSSFK